MARLDYVTNVSVDGFIEDRDGDFRWSEPDDEVFAFVTDLLRRYGTYVYGRRLYETMAVWETDPSFAASSELLAEFARVWSAADKVVCSTTLSEPLTARTRIERSFDPAGIEELKHRATADLLIGGADLAGQAFAHGLVDECQLLVHPVVLGGGKPGLADGTRARFELVEERRFPSGVVYLRYRVAG